MRFFHRNAGQRVPSLEEMEESPELLAAEQAVDKLPDGPPPENVYLDVVAGSRPQIVSFPDEGPGADVVGSDEGPRPQP